MLTDYALAGVTGTLGFLLYRVNQSTSARFWLLAFVAIAVGALLGGTYHGWHHQALWRPTVLTIGFASFGMVAGSAFAATGGSLRRALLALAAVKLVAYEAWMVGRDDFLFVVADTGSALLVVAALHLLALASPASRWMLAGVVVSLAAAGVQAGHVALHPQFNHNDLYHVVQIVAMCLYYAGVKRMSDATRAAATP